HQGSPKEIAQMRLGGEADIGLATETLAASAELASVPVYSWHLSVGVPGQHPLPQQPLTLEALTEYAMTTYHEDFTRRARVEQAFTRAGLVSEIVMSAVDADVIKSYVELGLGIVIIESIPFSAEHDRGVKLLDGAALFDRNETKLAIRKGHLLRHFAYRFIELCSADLTEQRIAQALAD